MSNFKDNRILLHKIFGEFAWEIVDYSQMCREQSSPCTSFAADSVEMVNLSSWVRTKLDFISSSC